MSVDAEVEFGYARVEYVDERVLGDELVSAVAVGATTLYVGDVAEFDEDGGWLTLNGSTVAYVSCDDDTSTIRLAAGLPVAGVEFDRVDSWNGPASLGGPDVEWIAKFYLDDQVGGDLQEATVNHAVIDKLPAGPREALIGESVRWERNGSDLEVTNIFERTPAIDTDFFSTPIVSGVYRVTKSIPPGSAWPLTDITTYRLSGFSQMSGIWYPNEAGYYSIDFGATWATNGSGSRLLQVVVVDSDTGVRDVLRPISVLPRPNGPTALETHTTRFLETYEGVAFEVVNLSGANLDLLGQDGDPLRRPTDFTILKVAR